MLGAVFDVGLDGVPWYPTRETSLSGSGSGSKSGLTTLGSSESCRDKIFDTFPFRVFEQQIGID